MFLKTEIGNGETLYVSRDITGKFDVEVWHNSQPLSQIKLSEDNAREIVHYIASQIDVSK